MRYFRAFVLVALIGAAGACDDDSTGPDPESIEITPASLDLGDQRLDSLELMNVGASAIGPIDIEPGSVVDGEGDAVPQATVTVDPERVSSLDVGATARVRVIVSIGSQLPTGHYSGEIVVRVENAAPRAVPFSFSVQGPGMGTAFTFVGHGAITDRFTSDLWVHSWPQGVFAYTGTWSCRNACGNRMYVWDVTDPTNPELTDSVVVEATTVNDVKIRADGALAVVTHEGSTPNGITLLDLSDPAHPSVITRFTERLDGGVHNVWIQGDYVYAVSDGTGGLEIIDISSPSAPDHVASFNAGSSFLHDVYVRDGLAFLAHWDAGLVILDVGNGIENGLPTSPVEVGRVDLGGNTHNAWYWPATGYVFVGEENFGLPPGNTHIVDASDLRNPVEVAMFTVTGETPHNFWLDEENAILYAAWYSEGLRVIDVSGDLQGELSDQGREITSLKYNGDGPCFSGMSTCVWAPQLHEGLVYLSDPNTGLWIFEPDF